MKKIILFLTLILACIALSSCGGGEEPTPPPPPSPTPILRGDSAVIFGANNSFTLVYGADNVSVGGTVASKIRTRLAELGLNKPEFASDAEKQETQCELLIGDTKRALSAAAKAELADEIAADPRGNHWIWLYRDGQLALWATDNESYELAIDEFIETSYKAGEVVVKTDTKSIGYVPGPHEAYMSYEVPDNFFDGYTDPFSMSEKDYQQMYLTSIDNTTYRISYIDENRGTFTADLVQKVWGVWMMGAISYTERNGTVHNITSSSTDYEFVLRVNGKGNSGLKSGNHGNYPKDSGWEYCEDDTSYYNDRMLDITFYDGKTGEKLELPTIGKTITANGIRIVEHHNIYEFNYKQENVLINAERSYLYNGYDIMCDTMLYMTQDVTISGGSYSTMLPISKQYGNCAMFYCVDGSTVYMKTPLSNTSNETRLGVNATVIDVWGENNPKYHMTVTLNTPEDQLRNSSKNGYTGFREMLGGPSNKVYCSLYSITGALEWGEELHFNTTWSFSIRNDFKNPEGEPDYWVGLPKE